MAVTSLTFEPREGDDGFYIVADRERTEHETRACDVCWKEIPLMVGFYQKGLTDICSDCFLSRKREPPEEPTWTDS